LRSDPTLASNVVSPELYQALDSTLAGKHGRDSIQSAKSNQPDATISTVTASRQFDSVTRTMKRQSDSLARRMSNMHAFIDTLRFVAVGLVLGAHDVVLRHSSTSIPAGGELRAGYDTATGPHYTIGGGLMKRLFPNMDLQREIQGVTIARVAGEEGRRRVVVIALRTTR